MSRCGSIVVEEPEAAIDEFPGTQIEPITFLAGIGHAGFGQRGMRWTAGRDSDVNDGPKAVVAQGVTHLRGTAAVPGDAKSGQAGHFIADAHRKVIIIVENFDQCRRTTGEVRLASLVIGRRFEPTGDPTCLGNRVTEGSQLGDEGGQFGDLFAPPGRAVPASEKENQAARCALMRSNGPKALDIVGDSGTGNRKTVASETGRTGGIAKIVGDERAQGPGAGRGNG